MPIVYVPSAFCAVQAENDVTAMTASRMTEISFFILFSSFLFYSFARRVKTKNPRHAYTCLGRIIISAVPPKLERKLPALLRTSYAAPVITGARPVGAYLQKLSATPSEVHSHRLSRRAHTIRGSLYRIDRRYSSPSTVWDDYIITMHLCQVSFAKKSEKYADFSDFLNIYRSDPVKCASKTPLSYPSNRTFSILP